MVKLFEHKKILTAGRLIAILSAVVLAASAFFPWGYTENVSVSGITGDGVITIGIGILACILIFIKRAPLWLSLILGAAGLAIGIIDFQTMQEAVKEIEGFVGKGLHMTIIASIGIVVGTFVEIIEERARLGLLYLDEK